MIVKTGKDYLMSKIYDGINSEGTGFKIGKIYLYNDNNETSYTYNIRTDAIDIKNKIELELKKADSEIGSKKYFEIDHIGSLNGGTDSKCISRYLKFKISNLTLNDNEDSKNINSLALFLIKEGTTEEILFSRIKFDTITITQTDALTLNYYIYF